MKSIIEEAPSILKAIEKAWARAGSPREFSVKIFEDSQKNFFGMTTKPAKVGVFFEIEPIQSESSTSELRRTGNPRYSEPRRTNEHQKSPSFTQDSHKEELKQRKPVAHTYRPQEATPFVTNNTENAEQAEQNQERKKQRIAWNDDMLTAVSMWLNDLLEKSDLGSHKATLTVLDNRLIVLFEQPLFDDPVKASDLYRSLSYLLIGMVRSKFKKEFRFLKIVLTDGQRDRDNES